MQEASAPAAVIGQNGKPTVVDFWAPVRYFLRMNGWNLCLCHQFLLENTFSFVFTLSHSQEPVECKTQWCENCKLMAPTLVQVEEEYKDKVNFVMVNGDARDAWPLIEAFGVDAIPHMALVSSEGDVETALIGPIPKRILEADLDGKLCFV